MNVLSDCCNVFLHKGAIAKVILVYDFDLNAREFCMGCQILKEFCMGCQILKEFCIGMPNSQRILHGDAKFSKNSAWRCQIL